MDKDVTPLREIFGSDTQGRLIFDLVRAIVTDRIKLSALEKILVDKNILDGDELHRYYTEVLSSSSDDVINQVLREYGSVDNEY